MKKIIYISFVFAFLIAFASCEKQEILPINNDDTFAVFDENGNGTKGTKDPLTSGTNIDESDGGGIVDPDEDDDDLDDDGGLDKGNGNDK